jgi:hypothetical protein
VKRLIIVLHRYLGAALCAMFAIWFASGIVIVFASFPHLDEAQRLRALPPLTIDGDRPLRPPGEALARTPAGGRIRLGMLGRRPVYRFVDGDRRAGVIDAETGAVAARPSSEALQRLADPYRDPAAPTTTATPATTIDGRDQWTLTGPASSQFPLRRLDAEVGDGVHRQIYVSLTTAEVVQTTTRRQRMLAWVGAIPHWIYPTVLRGHAAGWRRLVISVASLGALGSLSGLVLGVWNWRPRRRRRAGGARGGSPYRERWMRWHHYVGLGFGIFAFTWVGSGALSLDPFSGGGSPGRDAARLLAGGELQLAHFAVPPAAALAACRREIQPRELELIQIGGRPYYLCRQSPAETRLVAAGEARAALAPVRALAPELVLGAGRSLWPPDLVRDVAPLAEGDAYFEREAAAPDQAPLPAILRIRLRGGATWYYVDLATGRIVLALDAPARVEQWLYRGLHTLDPSVLLSGSPSVARFLPRPQSAAWYVAILGLSTVGLFFSATGIAVALGWLQRARQRRQKGPRPPDRTCVPPKSY